MQLSPEDAYQRFQRTIEAVNSVIEMYQPAGFDFRVSPEVGTVAWGSGLMGWAFTLPAFASMIASKQAGTPAQQAAVASKLKVKLWGENFLDRESGKWRTSSVSDSGVQLPRGFCQLVLQPIYDVFAAAKANRVADIPALIAKTGATVALSKTDLEATSKVHVSVFFCLISSRQLSSQS